MSQINDKDRLSEQAYWDSIYANSTPATSRHSAKKREPGSRWGQISNNYSEYLFWDLINRFLPNEGKKKFVEIGSAPGEYLINFSTKKQYEVFGIEYTQSGYEVNKQNFALAGLNPDNVIHGDLFDSGLQEKYQEYFDVVYSGGLIEHFTNPFEAIDRHVNLLKPGGILLITIPNLRHANYHLSNFFNKEIIKIHNLEIMTIDSFSKLFQNEGLDTIYLDYYGTFNLGLFTAKGKFKRGVLRLMQRVLSKPLNILFYLLFGKKGGESRSFSPYLIYIGKKKPAKMNADN